MVDDLVRPEPGRPDRSVDDAARPRGARLLVRVRLDAVRAGALPVREHRLVRAPLPGRLHRRVHRPDPRAGSTRCTSWPPRCSTGRRSAPASATASCSATTARRCRRACSNYPDPVRDVRHLRRRRHALVPAVVARPPRRRPGGDRGRASATRSARSCCRCGTRGTSCRCTPTPRAPTGAFRTDSDRRARPVRAGQDPRPGRGRLTECDGRLRPVRRVRRRCGPTSTSLTNWYIRRSRDRFWAGDQDAIDTLHTVLAVALPASRRRCCRWSPSRSTAASPASAACT